MTRRSGGALIGISLKLHLSPDDAVAWTHRVADLVPAHPAVLDGRVELFVLPALPALADVRRAFRGTPVRVGAQDLSPYDRGAYTGAISGADLVESGCAYVEVGHAERRRWFGEDDAAIGAKLAAAARNGLVPVLCVGEPSRGAPEAAIVECADRLDAVLAAAGPVETLVVAYEPEWAIGAADAARPDHIDAVCAGIRQHLDPRVRSVTILYGGSARPGLLPRLGCDVDGLFLGRFAHEPAALDAILHEAAERV